MLSDTPEQFPARGSGFPELQRVKPLRARPFGRIQRARIHPKRRPLHGLTRTMTQSRGGRARVCSRAGGRAPPTREQTPRLTPAQEHAGRGPAPGIPPHAGPPSERPPPDTARPPHPGESAGASTHRERRATGTGHDVTDHRPTSSRGYEPPPTSQPIIGLPDPSSRCSVSPGEPERPSIASWPRRAKSQQPHRFPAMWPRSHAGPRRACGR